MSDDRRRYPLSKADLSLFQRLEPAFRSLLSDPDLSPEEIVGIARAIRVVQRLPRCTPEIDVSISLDYRTNTFVSSSSVRLSPDQLDAERGAASRLGEGDEFESFPGFTLTIYADGDYDVDGDKQKFFNEFVASLEAVGTKADYSVTVIDDSTVNALPPLNEDDD